MHTPNTPVTKVIGVDFELSNSMVTDGVPDGSPDIAAELLLNEIRGYPLKQSIRGPMTERGRRFLRNGGCAYIDLNHLELCTPCHGRAAEHPLYIHTALRIARKAQIAAQAKLKQTKLMVIANSSDGKVSYGSHLRHSVSRHLFRELHHHNYLLAGFWATHLVTSILYTGQGAVGGANGREPCNYQLAQRPDYFSRLFNLETTQDRPIINLRDESHSATVAATHTIYFDRVLCPGACYLQAVTSQLVLAMMEAGQADTSVALADPVGSASAISRDLGLQQQFATVVPGRNMSAFQIQRAICTQVQEFVASGKCGNAVPDAEAGVAFWSETLDLLERQEIAQLAMRCDNWLKYLVIERQLSRRNKSWTSGEAKVLDILFGSLDPDQGIFFQMAALGNIEGMPTDDQIERALRTPPSDTRACLRAWLLRRFGEHIARMDWSYIDFDVPSGSSWRSVARLRLPDPRAFGMQHSFDLLHDHDSLTEIVDAVNAAATRIEETGDIPYDEYAEPISARPRHLDFS
ncbi:MAG: proteasome accessory factor PafA2 family protein [Planctomycetaceae bacterium]|nr:proteasome accessory factor PafA2 family protein [Planctomycetaceae bacterium]